MVQEVFEHITQDLDRYRILRGGSRWRALLSTQGAQASTVYRLGHWLYTSPRRSRLAMRVLRWVYLFLFRLVEMTTGISINATAQIGPGLYIGHFGGIIIGSGVVMGSKCNISQGVTIGVGGREEHRGYPRVGDRVYIGPGAKVFGPIEIGNDVAIGANAVVTRSLPDRAVVGGVPAQIVSYRGSFEFVRYFGMEDDPERKQSLALRGSQGEPDMADNKAQGVLG